MGVSLFYGMFVHIILINAFEEWYIVGEKGKNVTGEIKSMKEISNLKIIILAKFEL